MDDCRFDDLARAFARGTTRRRVLQGLVGGIAAGLTALRGAESNAMATRTRRQAAGASCTRAFECASFHCVDGVCCDGPCLGQCETCATGTCLPATGAPAGNRPACPGSGDCAGVCDGITRAACVFPGAEVTCGEPACAHGVQTSFACAGNGSCHPSSSYCGLVRCNDEGTTCLTTCASDDDCVGDAFCASGVCVGDGALGAPCTGDNECLSGVCADDVCCTEACGECQSCNLPGSAGTCVFNENGSACDGGVCCGGTCCDGDHVCVDGICQAPVCRALLEECTAVDQCCQDEPTGCADVVGCGGSRNQCCSLPGSSCEGNCDCCGPDHCVEGVCVASCVELGDDCTADEHCCTGICDEVGRCFDPDFGVSCDNPVAEGTCGFPGACPGCEIDGVCFEACDEGPLACVTTTEGANRCVIAVPVAGRGCVQSSDCGVGRACFEDCTEDRSCFDAPLDTCLTTCRTVGADCQFDGECCSNLCSGGFCGPE